MKLLGFLTIFASLAGSCAFADDVGFGVNAGVHWGLGKMYNSTYTIPVRTMNTLDLQALPGVRWGNWLFGVLGEVRFVGQNTDFEQVANQNMRGTGYLLGIGGTYLLGDYKFLASFDLIGKHSLSTQDPNGNDVTYQKPRGLHLQGAYRVWREFYAELALSIESYKTSSLAGSDADISNSKFTHWNAGVGISYNF